VRYLRRKLLHLIPVFFLVTFASFATLNLLPGNIVDHLLAHEEGGLPSEETRQALMKEFDLDRPIAVRYAVWLGNLVRGDLGRSLITREKITPAILRRLPVTLQLIVTTQLIAIGLAGPLGIYTAYKAGRRVDKAIAAVAFGFLAAPTFIVAVVLIIVFAISLDWMPAAGYVPLTQDFWGSVKSLLLPAFAIGAHEVVVQMRVLRTDLIATLQEEYISLAKAKGLSSAYILFRHALRPSSFTWVTIIGLQMGFLISGSVVVESIFALPGLGRLLVESIDARDETMVQGIVVVVALGYVFINFAVDMLYAVLDPRVARAA
jgi:peptide/nickel transport system permease protein